MGAVGYIPPDRFTPESRIHWRPVGRIRTWEESDERGIPLFKLWAASGHLINVYVMSPTMLRIRFDPNPEHAFVEPRSPATIALQVAPVEGLVAGEARGELEIQTAEIVVRVRLDHYKLTVYRQGQLIHSDTDEYNLVYIPGHHVIANFKKASMGARYFGFGEKAGATLDKRRVPDWHFERGWVPDRDFGWFSGSSVARRPSRLTFFNYDNYEYNEETHAVSIQGERAGPLNPNIPLYQSSPTWMECNPQPDGEFQGSAYATGILFDNTSQSFVNLAQGNEYYFGALFGELDYYLFAGGKPAAVLDELTQATGRTHVKPRWALGYHQAGFGPNYNCRDRIMEVAQAYRDARIPIDGLHIDIDILDNDRQFSVSRRRFPDVVGMFRSLHDMGYKLSTNITPTIGYGPGENGDPSYPPLASGRERGVFVTNRRFGGDGDDEPLKGRMNYGDHRRPPVHVPDLGKEDVQEWWAELYRHWTELGLDMVWQDMTTPCLGDDALRSLPMDCMVWDNENTRFEDVTQPSRKVPFGRVRNLFAFNLCKATFEGLTRLRPDQRNFIIARGGFIGEHRYAGTWTGDNTSDWEFLLLNIPQVLNMGLTAQPVAGADVGGYGGRQCGEEMLVRWTTLGAFLPWFRNHYGHYGGRKSYQEPFRMEYSESVRAVCRKYIELRYRLLQVFYDAMHENHRTGLPIVHPPIPAFGRFGSFRRS
jgi:alpha-glucosidase